MKRRARRIAASLLTAVMLFQQCSATGFATEAVEQSETAVATELAAEGETKAPQTEPETQAPQTEPQTQAPQTEPQTQAPQTEPQTQAPQTEPQTQAPQTEPQTQAPQTEPQTQAPQTEPQTQAPQTEPQTQAPQTEPQTQAPQTEPQTQAPQTEPQTQAPQTEPQTQAPQTEPQTQAPQTEPQTQAPQTETPGEKQTETPGEKQTEEQTEAPAEKQTGDSEKKTEAEETELSERVNDGEKIDDTTLTSRLSGALPYLFAASEVTLPEGLEVRDGLIADGADGSSIAGSLADFSKTLANGKSTSMVRVLNVYADKKGKLDDSQIKKLFKDGTLDVTDQYFVVNIIAHSRNQELDFSGYPMVISGRAVSYSEQSQPGDILYNFAALDGETYVSFEGTVNLSGGTVQGTYLAPKAAVNVRSDLAGAVYADQIRVSDGVEKLTRIVLVKGAAKEKTETESAGGDSPEEADTEEASETTEQTEQTTEAGSQAEESLTETSTAGPEAVLPEEPSSETVPLEATLDISEVTPLEADPGQNTDPAQGTDPTQSTDPAQGANPTQSTDPTQSGDPTQSTDPTQSGDPTQSTDQTQSGDPTQSTDQTQSGDPTQSTDQTPDTDPTQSTDPAPGGEPEPPAGGEIDAGDPAEENPFIWYGETGVTLELRVSDAEDAQKKLTGGSAVIRAGETVYGQDGTAVYEKDAEVAPLDLAEASARAELHYGGNYYLEFTKLPDPGDGTSYLSPARIYFEIDAAGKPVMGSAAQFTWDGSSVLTVALQKKAQAVVSLTDAADPDGTGRLSGAVFVLKDQDGNVITGTDGYPAYYLSYEGTDLSLYGLAAETVYYLSQIKAPEGYLPAADVEFTTAAADVQTPVEVKVTNAKPATGSKALGITVQSSFNGTVLTAEKNQTTYLALFADAELTTRVSEVRAAAFSKGASASAQISFDGLDEKTTYYAGAVDEFGRVLAAGTERTYELQTTGKQDASVTLEKSNVVLQYLYTTYPEKNFSWETRIPVKVEVKDNKGAAKKTQETFYVMLFSDKEMKKPALSAPIAFAMKGASSKAAAVRVKLKKAAAAYYIAETDADGKIIPPASENFKYGITYSTTPSSADQKLSLVCGSTSEVTVINKLNDTVVKLRVEDGSGALLSGAKLVLKDTVTGKNKTIQIDGEALTVFESRPKEIVLENQLEPGIYALTEITAPSGYRNTSDTVFTVEEGMTVEAVLKNEKIQKTGYSITAIMQVFGGQNQVYARDTTTGEYAAEGRYTFYAALFSDSARTKKVSDVQKITVSAFTGTTQFGNLTAGSTYYLTETDEYGNVLRSADSLGTVCTIQYTSGGKIEMNASGKQAVIRNTYEGLPRGYRYTAVLTLKKVHQTSAGEAENVSKTFYAGIYRMPDYSDTPTVVPLTLNNTSEVSERRRILLSGTSDVTYYIAEVDENGKRITENTADFGYTVNVDQPTVTLSGGDEKTVTITNKVKVSKVTLYLTKKVYKGTEQHAVNATFYAGLFKDPEFTQLYAKPIPLQLKGKSEITLKLTLNLGSASEATIYVAEVDENGKLVQEGEKFGYNVRIVNATAAFTQERTEIQSILLNSVYSATEAPDWNRILNEDDNNLGGSGYISSNGVGGSSGAGSTPVQTGDDTPVLLYVLVLVAAAAVLAGILVVSIRKKKRK